MSKCLVINGNPKKESLCKTLAESYKQGYEESNRELEIFHISDLEFNIDLSGGYDHKQELEKDLKTLQKAISASSHITIISPIWWGIMPAKLKGIIDRVFLPDFAFKCSRGKAIPEKLLKGKTSRIIITMDAPSWYYRFVLGDPIIKALNKPTLALCGIKLENVSRFGLIKNATPEKKKHWIYQAKAAGIKDSKKRYNHSFQRTLASSLR